MLPYAEGNGCETFGAIGTCWGSYMVIRMAAHPKMLAGVSMHPSHSPIMENLGENEEEILNEIQVRIVNFPLKRPYLSISSLTIELSQLKTTVESTLI